ncbi:hypothetical protein Taro_030149 [Colocasia esculenta]|uniref:RING-type E3 ubiquitin transferase n=1 Tax=Colocasia esculenta TaxID=4460 RepID=A0A843VTA0_COLES|nr:hypothetical protein [Colocasia esculenta]
MDHQREARELLPKIIELSSPYGSPQPLRCRCPRPPPPHGQLLGPNMPLPTLVYADVKEHKIGKGALECIVCLCKFEDDDTLRLLPKCDHVFHPDCIDAWLFAQTTYPICRANLSSDPNAATPKAVPIVPYAAEEVNAVTPTTVVVDGAGSGERHMEGADNSTAAAAIVTGQSDHVAITIDVPPTPESVQKKSESSLALLPTDRMARVESKSRLPWQSKSSLRPPRFPRSH